MIENAGMNEKTDINVLTLKERRAYERLEKMLDEAHLRIVSGEKGITLDAARTEMKKYITDAKA